ncbi:hypothetical protein C8R45DRAFT_477467 [Mycena sanguinolenta]|nr:hypothetical protein C8R45DRAFT_477467 [Mycena sanguinolenta]
MQNRFGIATTSRQYERFKYAISFLVSGQCGDSQSWVVPVTVPEGHALSAFYSAFHSGNDHPIPIPDDPELWAFPLRASPHDEAIGFIKCYRTGRGGKGIWSAPGGPGGHCTPGLVTIQPGVTMLEEDGVDLEDSHTEDGLESEAEPAGGELEDSYTEDGVEPEEETAERDNEGGESETRTEPSEDARE